MPQERIPVTIAYIGGGSLNWALTLMGDLAVDERLSATVRLYDIDLGSAQRNAKIGENYSRKHPENSTKYEVFDSLEQAVSGADVVVISILPGTLDDMKADLMIPARYGIPQAVGDTVGPGGILRAARSIPMFVEIAKAIQTHAPDAYVCNLTNPMSVLTGTLFKVFPEIKAWGECHEVTKIRRQVATLANAAKPDKKWTFHDVSVNVLGINHFTFVDQMIVDGQDMAPAYLEFMKAHANGVISVEPGRDAEHAAYFASQCLVAFDLYDRFGVFGAAGDRHLAEFLPADEYLRGAEAWGFALTPIEYRVKDRARRIDMAQELANGTLEPQAKRSDEAMIDQIAALMGADEFVSNVNLPNMGQLSGFAEGAIVETNARFSADGIEPIAAGALPEALHAIVNAHSLRQEQVLSAVLGDDRAALFEAFSGDPLVAPLQKDTAYQMFDEMIEATGHLLPAKLKGAA